MKGRMRGQNSHYKGTILVATALVGALLVLSVLVINQGVTPEISGTLPAEKGARQEAVDWVIETAVVEENSAITTGT